MGQMFSSEAPAFLPTTDPAIVQAMTSLGNRISFLENQYGVYGKELMILEGLIKQSLDPKAYVDARKRIEAELFPPPASVDKAEIDDIKQTMANIQEQHGKFQDEALGMMRDFAEDIKEMSQRSRDMQELREQVPAPQHEPEELDRGTEYVNLEEPEAEDTPEPEHPPYICPNCNAKVPNELKNEHTCEKQIPPPKKKTPKKK